jgi:phosphoribosylformylglycinamidine (FGAM) synthase-like amidotransferase family enzyme
MPLGMTHLETTRNVTQSNAVSTNGSSTMFAQIVLLESRMLLRMMHPEAIRNATTTPALRLSQRMELLHQLQRALLAAVTL